MMKKYTLYLLALMMFLPSLARADIHASAGCSSTQINAAISAAVDGDTVTVPACAETAWDADVTIPNTKGITLQGNGLASTYINTNSHTLTINTLSTNQKVRVTGFNFVRTDSDDIIYIDGTAQDWRIDHNAINGGASAYGGYLVRIWNYTYGLIDANTFTNYSIAIQHRWNDSRDTARGGDYVWSLPAQRGTVQAVYIENNTFTGADDPLQTVDGSFGVKYVTRYNNNNNPAEHSHSGCTPGGRNAIWVEHYNNAYTDDANRSYAPVWFRSVSGIVANNTFAADMVGTAVLIDHERGWRTDCTEAAGAKNETCDGTRAYDQNTADQHGYICRGQPGWGQPQNADVSETTFQGVFAFGNVKLPSTTLNMVLANTEANPNPSGGTDNYSTTHIKAGREFFNEANMTIGPIASRPATCSAGPADRAVYVSNNELTGGGNIIYICSATNTWTEHWKPYTCPHPLAGLTGKTCNSAVAGTAGYGIDSVQISGATISGAVVK